MHKIRFCDWSKSGSRSQSYFWFTFSHYHSNPEDTFGWLVFLRGNKYEPVPLYLSASSDLFFSCLSNNKYKSLFSDGRNIRNSDFENKGARIDEASNTGPDRFNFCGFTDGRKTNPPLGFFEFRFPVVD